MTRKGILSLRLPIHLINSNSLNWYKKKIVKTSKPLNIRGFDVFVGDADGSDLSAI